MLINKTIRDFTQEFLASGLIKSVEGEQDHLIAQLSPVEDCQLGDLIFVDKKEYVAPVLAREFTAVVTTPSLAESFRNKPKIGLLIADNVGLAHAILKKSYASRDFSQTGFDGIHSTSVIHETAIIGDLTVIEPHVVIGQNVRIGRHCRIMAGAVIENDVQIGNETIVHPKAVIHHGSLIGNECVIGAGSVVGSEGYGFAQTSKAKSIYIPQTGIVVLEDRVRLGANNCIDRAAYRETRIGAGTKLDNLIHIGHNVQIGEDCLLTAGLCVGGSTTIGNRVRASGQTGIIDHLKITDDVIFAHRAGVVQNVLKPGVYAGLPLLPMAEYMRNINAMKTVAEMRKRLIELEKKVGISKEPHEKDIF